MKELLPIIQPVLRARPYHPEASAAYLDRETAKRDAANFAELTGREMKVVKDGKLFRLEQRRRG